jgi:hypothetical protein
MRELGYVLAIFGVVLLVGAQLVKNTTVGATMVLGGAVIFTSGFWMYVHVEYLS